MLKRKTLARKHVSSSHKQAKHKANGKPAEKVTPAQPTRTAVPVPHDVPAIALALHPSAEQIIDEPRPGHYVIRRQDGSTFLRAG